MEDRKYTYHYPLAYVNYGQEEIAAVIDTLQQGRTTCGPQVRTFEETFAEYVGARHSVMVNSGSSADMLVAFGLGEPDGRDEILVPAVTWPTQVWSCLTAGYKVRLIDVDPATLQIDLNDLARHINTNTRAVFLVHLLGNVCDMDALKTILQPFEGVDLIEDCCEALGARFKGQHVGTFGKAGAFSFFFSHLISTMEGGMVTCQEPDRKYRLLRSHGWEPQPDCRFWFPGWGFNVRPTEVQGAFGNVQMTKIDQFREARLYNAERLQQQVRQLDWLQTCQVVDGGEPCWHGFPLLIKSDEPGYKHNFVTYLEQHGIETRPVVAGNLANQKAVTEMKPGRVAFDYLPGADWIDTHGIYIGLPSSKDDAAMDYVGDILQKYSC